MMGMFPPLLTRTWQRKGLQECIHVLYGAAPKVGLICYWNIYNYVHDECYVNLKEMSKLKELKIFVLPVPNLITIVQKIIHVMKNLFTVHSTVIILDLS